MHPALGALPALFLLLTTLLIRRRATGPLGSWRESLLLAAVITGVWCALGTELLALLDALGPRTSLAWWGLPTLSLAAAFLMRRASPGPSLPAPRTPRDPWTTLIRSLTLVILGLCLILAATAPPNNADALAYHLPRQVYWLQQGNLDHFPTNTLRQTIMPPLAEFFGLHLFALSGCDAWHNLVQWVALVVATGASSLISRDLGASTRGQALAALVTVSMPGTIMQGCNAKNDLLLGVWILALLLCAVRILNDGRCDARRTLLIGASLGLALLTKGTAPLIALPICATIGLTLLHRRRLRCIPSALAIAALAASLNSGYWARNLAIYHAPFGPPDHAGGFGVTNQTHAPAPIASVLLRNAALHAATPWPAPNIAIQRAIKALHAAAGLDPDDPRTTYHASPPFSVFWSGRYEDSAGGPAHLLLALLLPALALSTHRRERRTQLVVLILPYASFLLMCILLKWQIWNARLHVPVACMLGAVSGPLLDRMRHASLALAALMVAVATPSLLFNTRRPLIGPKGLFRTQYADRRYLDFPDPAAQRALVARMAARAVALNPESIGILIANSNYFFEYLAIRVLRDAGVRAPIRAFNAPYGPTEDPNLPAPDLVLWIPYLGGERRHVASGTTYVLDDHFGPFWMFVKGTTDLLRDDPYPPSLISIADRFRGWTLVEGLDAPEGPYPKLDLPSIRWGIGPRTVLDIRGTGRELQLVTTCRTNGRAGQGITFRLNGEVIHEHAFGDDGDFQTIRVPLGTILGPARLTLEYTGQPLEDGRRPLSVLYQSIVVVAARPATSNTDNDSPNDHDE